MFTCLESAVLKGLRIGLCLFPRHKKSNMPNCVCYAPFRIQWYYFFTKLHLGAEQKHVHTSIANTSRFLISSRPNSQWHTYASAWSEYIQKARWRTLVKDIMQCRVNGTARAGQGKVDVRNPKPFRRPQMMGKPEQKSKMIRMLYLLYVYTGRTSAYR